MQSELSQLSLTKDAENIVRFHLEGGHVCSWTCAGKEQLFMSEKAEFVPGKTAIRGGIPICWPAFDTKNLKAGKHGIVRTSDQWLVAEKGDDDGSGDPFVVLQYPTVYLKVADAGEITGYYSDLEPDRTDLVPAQLSLKLVCGVGKLKIEMHVKNQSPKRSFAFSTVLHSYFAVAMPVTIRGLQGRSGLLSGQLFTDVEEAVVVDGVAEVQRLYTDVTTPVSWSSSGTKTTTLTKSPNLPDVVVWNCGRKGCLKDMHEGGELGYTCIESGICASADCMVAAGETWTGWQELAVA